MLAHVSSDGDPLIEATTLSMREQSGILYIVATPIGNLADISKRALTVLAEVGVIYAEDTRHSRHLLNAYGLKTKLVSLHEHNEESRVPEVIALIKRGVSVALISDAGTPLISDPGYRLVAECHRQDIRMSPIPGASALISALSVSGLPTNSFLFLGFPPPKSTLRRKWFAGLANETQTMIFYESKHRIIPCLEAISEQFGQQRLVALGRELTKQYETIRQASVDSLLQWMKSHKEQQKGEFVLIVAGAQKKKPADNQSLELLELLLPDLSVKRSVEIVYCLFGGKKNDLYKQALQLKAKTLS